MTFRINWNNEVKTFTIPIKNLLPVLRSRDYFPTLYRVYWLPLLAREVNRKLFCYHLSNVIIFFIKNALINCLKLGTKLPSLLFYLGFIKWITRLFNIEAKILYILYTVNILDKPFARLHRTTSVKKVLNLLFSQNVIFHDYMFIYINNFSNKDLLKKSF